MNAHTSPTNATSVTKRYKRYSISELDVCPVCKGAKDKSARYITEQPVAVSCSPNEACPQYHWEYLPCEACNGIGIVEREPINESKKGIVQKAVLREFNEHNNHLRTFHIDTSIYMEVMRAFDYINMVWSRADLSYDNGSLNGSLRLMIPTRGRLEITLDE